MSTRWFRRGLRVPLLALLIAVSVGSVLAFLAGRFDQDGSDYGANVGPDPRSLAEVSYAGGGAAHRALSIAEIAELSDLAIEVVVVDVRPSRLNTSNGRFPSAEEIDEHGLGDLVVLTDVVLEVQRTIGRDAAVAAPVDRERFVISVGGGTIFTSLDEAQARAAGVTQEIELAKDGGPTGSPEEGQGNQPDPHRGEEVPWEGPVSQFVWGFAPSEQLAEGDRIVVLLTWIEIDGYSGGPNLQHWTPTHPSGLFKDLGGDWIADRTGEKADLDQIRLIISG